MPERSGPAQVPAWADLQVAFEASPCQVTMVAGPDHRLVYQNPASIAVLGARPLGAPAAEGFNDYPEWVQALDDVLNGGEVIRFHRAPMAVPGRGGGDRVILLDTVFSPVLAEGGSPAGVMCQAVDVTLSAATDSQADVAVTLQRVSLELARSLDPDQVARAVSRLAAGTFEGWVVLDLYQADGSLARTHSFHSDPAKQEDLALMCSLPRVTGRITGRGESLASTAARTGETFTGRFDTAAVVAAASSALHARVLGSLQPDSYMIVPVQVGPRRLGSMSVLRTVGGPSFTPADRFVAQQFAERAAIALGHARDYDEQRQATLAVQRNLLPVPATRAEGVQVAVRYRSAGVGSEIGGDWYDILDLDDGSVAVIVGDVEGHDLAAVAVMSQIRAVVHAFAGSGMPPGRVAEQANSFLASLHTDRLVTFSYMHLYPAGGLAVGVRAGHMPAAVVEPGRPSRLLDERGGVPLGADPDARWPEGTVQVRPGALFALFTDGLVEVPRGNLAHGLDQLLGLLDASRNGDMEQIADGVLDGMDGSDRRDDMALVLLRLTGPALTERPGEHRARRRFPPETSSTPIARRFAADVLGGWGVDAETVEWALLLISELVTNAIRHADRPIELRMDLSALHLRVAVFDDSHRSPYLRHAELDETGGRGLQLVEYVATEWGVDTGDTGKWVWFTLPRMPPGSGEG